MWQILKCNKACHNNTKNEDERKSVVERKITSKPFMEQKFALYIMSLQPRLSAQETIL